MKEMLLFGAGGSAESNIPTAYEMTGKMLGLLRQFREFNNYGDILSFIIGGLLFEKGQKGENPLTCGINVEELFNAVDLLSQRNTLEAAAFIGSWHSMVEEFDRIEPTIPRPDRLHEAIFKSVTAEILKAFQASPPSFGANNIDRRMTETLHKALAAILWGFSSSANPATIILMPYLLMV